MNINPLWYFCILIRLIIIYIIYYINKKYNYKYSNIIKKIILIFLGCIGIGFIYKAITGSNNEIQLSKVFWHETRYVHGTLYILSTIYLLFNNLNISLLLLFLDVIFSIFYRILLKK